MDDEFATNAAPSYSKDSFYVGATDSKGHGAKSYLNIPPLMKGEIASLVASRTIPVYRTEMDFWRDAGVHRLHDLQEMLKDDAPIMSSQMNLLARRLKVESDLEYLRRTIEADTKMYDDSMFLMERAPMMGTADKINAAISEISDPELKKRLSSALDAYAARYQLKD